jgi:hypothetical protein
VNQADLFDKIRDRAASDTGSGGLFDTGGARVSGFYYGAMPSASVMPFCFFNVPVMPDMSTFTSNVLRVIFRISSFVAREHATITDPIQRLSEICKRIYGDSATGSLVPSYGFHRYTLTLTDWTGGSIRFIQPIEEHGDDYYCIVQEFELFISK